MAAAHTAEIASLKGLFLEEIVSYAGGRGMRSRMVVPVDADVNESRHLAHERQYHGPPQLFPLVTVRDLHLKTP